MLVAKQGYVVQGLFLGEGRLYKLPLSLLKGAYSHDVGFCRVMYAMNKVGAQIKSRAACATTHAADWRLPQKSCQCMPVLSSGMLFVDVCNETQIKLVLPGLLLMYVCNE